MVCVELILSPDLRTSSMKTSRFLKEEGGGYETILFDLPTEMEGMVRDLADGKISYEDLIDGIRRLELIPEPIDAWEYVESPILESLPQIAEKFPHLAVSCYGSREQEFASMESAVELTRLTLRTLITGEVEIEKWRDAVEASLEAHGEAAKRQAEKVLGEIGEETACLSDMEGRRLKRILGEKGVETKIRYVERFYHFKPLTILKRKMARGDVGDGEVEELVRLHAEYIRRYLYKFDNRDRAHYEWEYNNIPLLRQRIDKNEIRLLDNLIEKP